MDFTHLFDTSHTLARYYLAGFQYPWQALPGLKQLIVELGQALDPADFTQTAPAVWVHKTADIAPTAYLGSPCIIGANTQVRHCAFIRGAVLAGEGCVVGNSVELKNVILFDEVQVPHYNYVGDSILGYKAHMGAGAVTSNVKSDKSPVVVHSDPELPTGLKKLGAILGDRAEVGCNSVLNPGTVIGPDSNIYPTACVRGVIPANSIYKADGTVVPKQ